MALRGIQPQEVKKRLKCLFYGAAGVGKTMASISFPKPYLIDTEKGATNDQYIKILKENEGCIFSTNDFDDLLKEVNSLLTEKHSYKTLIIDPITTIYHDLLEKSAKERTCDKDPDGTAFGGHYNAANKKIKHLLNLLLRLDMNIIITCHAKNEYGANLSLLGQTYDGYKKLDYLFDLVFEVQKRGKERVGIVRKSRLEKFEDGETFPFCYAEIKGRHGGQDVLEKEAVPELLATVEQVSELNRLINLLKVPSETVEKWLSKSGSETLEEMNTDTIDKCIKFLLSQMTASTLSVVNN